MRTALAAVATVAFVLALAACGSSSSSSSSGGTGPTSSSLVAKVSNAKASFAGSQIVASADVEEGGHPGEKLTLRYGLVDAVSGTRASEQEQIAARYVTTSQVKKLTETVKIPKPTPTDYLVHFVIYAPDGSYLASSDSDVFTVGS
jgi:hypothetical protein